MTKPIELANFSATFKVEKISSRDILCTMEKNKKILEPVRIQCVLTQNGLVWEALHLYLDIRATKPCTTEEELLERLEEQGFRVCEIDRTPLDYTNNRFEY